MYNEKKFIEKLQVFGLFAFIPLVAFIAVIIIPFILGLYLTFTDSGALISFDFIGFENYRQAFADPNFWNAFGVTLRFVIKAVLLTNIIGLSLALLVTSVLKGQNFFRVGFSTPNLIGGVILGYLWQFIFVRMLPYIGQTLNLEILSSSWLSDPTRALWALVIVSVWQGSGYMMLIYIAGLMGIPKSLLEAAELDGASPIQKLIRIKAPLMLPAFTICLFLTVRGSFMMYDLNLTLTNGGPFQSTEMISMHIFNEAFQRMNFGVAQAQAVMLFVVVAIVAVLQVKAMKKFEVES